MNAPTLPPPLQVIPFIAESAADAVAQIRAKLGPDAVVVNVRQLPADGLAKLWKSPRIEVLAYKPDAQVATVAADPLAELKQELQAIRQQLGPGPGRAGTVHESDKTVAGSGPARRVSARLDGAPAWRVGEVLQTSGLAPVHAQRIVDQLQATHGET